MGTNDIYSLALEYHENTKAFPDVARPYDLNVSYKVYPNAKTILLASNNYNITTSGSSSFETTLLMRKSTRSFASENIGLNDLATLLTLSFGRKDSQYRTYASAGARYPIEVYIMILRSDDLEKGIYHYNVVDNTLEFIKPGDYTTEMKSFYNNQKEDCDISLNFPCLILFSIVFDRTMQKYGERGYRFLYLDAGHMSQNLYLVATYLKLGIVALGAGDTSDDRLDDIIGLIHSEENFFIGFALGHPNI